MGIADMPFNKIEAPGAVAVEVGAGASEVAAGQGAAVGAAEQGEVAVGAGASEVAAGVSEVAAGQAAATESASAAVGAAAAGVAPAAAEDAWRADNLPAEDLRFRWRYAGGDIQLYERRLRSLASFGIGPAVQAWVRSRLEWTQENRLRSLPDGVLELSVSTQGDVGMGVRAIGEAPTFDEVQLVWDGDRLTGCSMATQPCPGTVWIVTGSSAHPFPAALRHAADTFVRDLLETFGYSTAQDIPTRALLDEQGAELFLVNDEFGVIGCTDRSGDTCARLAACFDKLWSA